MTPEDIVNMALDQIRARATVTSINPSDGSLSANVASRNYQPRIDALSRSAHWNCLRYQASLTLIKAAAGTPENPAGTTLPTPPLPWLYEYLQPVLPLCLKARYLVPVINPQTVTPPLTTGGILTLPWVAPFGAVPFVASTDTDASGNFLKVILTNAPSAILVYTARVDDPTLWDSNFVDAAVATLASWFCEPITGSTALLNSKVALARALVEQARISDGNEGTTTSDHTPDWIAIRYGGPSNLVGTPNLANYEAMSLPGLVF